jgi:hypothetical protein
MTIDPNLPMTAEDGPIPSPSTEGQLSLDGVRFVIDLDVVDLQLLIASIGTTLEHPQMRTTKPETLALVSEYTRLRDELWKMVATQLEAGQNQRQLRRAVRRRWVRPERRDGDDGTGTHTSAG